MLDSSFFIQRRKNIGYLEQLLVEHFFHFRNFQRHEQLRKWKKSKKCLQLKWGIIPQTRGCAQPDK